VHISIIVPAFNEEKLLGESLNQITAAAKAFAARGWTHELIVCDNNSKDRTAEIARAAGATVIFEPINQIARARNTGASIATGDWLIFVDADSHPSAGLFDDVAAAIISGRCLAGGSTMRLDEPAALAGMIAGLWNLVSRFGRWLAGSFIFVETSAFRQLGGFSHEFFAGEELEFSKRLKRLARQQGRRLVILSKHPLTTSARKLKLYTAREHLRLLGRVGVNRKVLADRDACALWYDGRR
jgi:glycosyltransferase involved in cell wall biosynthesis